MIARAEPASPPGLPCAGVPPRRRRQIEGPVTGPAGRARLDSPHAWGAQRISCLAPVFADSSAGQDCSAEDEMMIVARIQKNPHWAEFVQELAERNQALRRSPSSGFPEKWLEETCTDILTAEGRTALYDAFLGRVSACLAPFSFGAVRPVSGVAFAQRLSPGEAESSLTLGRAALLLGCPPPRLLLLLDGQAVDDLRCTLESLRVSWLDAYRALPSLFEAGGLPSAGDGTDASDRWQASIFGRGMDVSFADPRGVEGAVVDRIVFASIAYKAAVHACTIQPSRASVRTIADRAIMFAAVLGSVDQGGRRILLFHSRVSARLPWERFRGGDWQGTLRLSMQDPRRPELGSQPERFAPRRLAIRASVWLQKELPDADVATDAAALELLERLRLDLMKYVKMGRRQQR